MRALTTEAPAVDRRLADLEREWAYLPRGARQKAARYGEPAEMSDDEAQARDEGGAVLLEWLTWQVREARRAMEV